MFANKIIFLVSISRHVRFYTVQYIGKRTTGNISKYLGKINDVYFRHGIYVEALYMDREFKNTRNIIPRRSTLNTTAASENVPEIERQIRVIK